MTYKDFTLKNFRMNSKRYLAYFLCISFTVMAFFMYSNLLFHRELLLSMDDSLRSTSILGVSVAVLALFSLFFILYAHTSFLKSRRKEFGLFLTLGMSRSEIGRIISMENGLVGLFSMALGLIGGTVFSRLFYMAFVGILGLQNVAYRLDIRSYFLTVSLFALIFVAVIFISRSVTGKMEIVRLLKSSRNTERNWINSPVPGIVGIFMILGAILSVLNKPAPEELDSDFVYAILICIAGLYLVISHFGSLLLSLMKKGGKVYYRQLLFTSGINYRFNRNKWVIFITGVLCAVTIFFIGIFYTLYSGALEQAAKQQPYHISYAEYMGYNRLTGEALVAAVQEDGNPVVEEGSVELLRVRFGFPAAASPGTGKTAAQGSAAMDPPGLYETDVISESQYNLLAKSKLHVEKGHFINLRLTSAGKTDSREFPFPTVNIFTGKSMYRLAYDETICDMPFNRPRFLNETIKLLSDEDYGRIKAEAGTSSILVLKLFNFRNWLDTGPAIRHLEEALNKANAKIATDNPEKIPETENSLRPVSRLEYFTELKQGSGTTLYLFGFIGFIFFAASGCVLYFRLFSELDGMKDRFRKLFNVGITGREMKKLIMKELRLVFYLPLGLGGILSCFLIYALSGNDSAEPERFIAGAVVITGVYFLFQSVYYFITKQKYFEEILEPYKQAI